MEDNAKMLDAARSRPQFWANHVPLSKPKSNQKRKRTRYRVDETGKQDETADTANHSDLIEVERVQVVHSGQSPQNLSRRTRRGPAATASLLGDESLQLQFVDVGDQPVVICLRRSEVQTIAVGSAIEFVMASYSMLLLVRHVHSEALLGQLAQSNLWGDMVNLEAMAIDLLGLPQYAIAPTLQHLASVDSGPISSLKENNRLASDVISLYLELQNQIYRTPNRSYFYDDTFFQYYDPHKKNQYTYDNENIQAFSLTHFGKVESGSVAVHTTHFLHVFTVTGAQRLDNLNVLGAIVHINGNHWVAVVAFIPMRIVLYFDPMGNPDQNGISRAFEHYIRRELLDQSPKDSWRRERWSHSSFRTMQSDGKFLRPSVAKATVLSSSTAVR